jgi:integrase
MASIYEKRPGKWFAKIKDEHGIWRDRALDARTKGEAKRVCLDMEIEIEGKRKQLGLLSTADRTWTVNQMLEWCLQTYWQDSSQARVRSLHAHFRDSDLGRSSVAEVQSGIVEQFLQAKQQALSPRRINYLRAHLHAAYNYAKAAGRFRGVNPVTEVRRRKVPKRISDYLRYHEVPRVLDAVAPQWRDFVTVALWTGLRKGELGALERSDVDIDARTLTIRRSWKRDQTKGGHVDVIPIAEPIVSILKAAMERSPTSLVFPRADGSMIREDVDLANILRSAFRRAGIVTGYAHKCRRAGCGHNELSADNASRRCPKCDMKLWSTGIVRPIRFHDTRHTTATLLLKSGVPLVTVQKILRHTDSRITSEVYGHLDLTDMHDGMKKLSEKMPVPFALPPATDENPSQAVEALAANLAAKSLVTASNGCDGDAAATVTNGTFSTVCADTSAKLPQQVELRIRRSQVRLLPGPPFSRQAFQHRQSSETLARFPVQARHFQDKLFNIGSRLKRWRVSLSGPAIFKTSFSTSAVV